MAANIFYWFAVALCLVSALAEIEFDVFFERGPLGIYLVSDDELPEGVWVSGFSEEFESLTHPVEVGDRMIRVGGTIIGDNATPRLVVDAIRAQGYPLVVRLSRPTLGVACARSASHLLRCAEKMRLGDWHGASSEFASAYMHPQTLDMTPNNTTQRGNEGREEGGAPRRGCLLNPRRGGSGEQRIVVSLTTTHDRIPSIGPVLESLLFQHHVLDVVYLWVPNRLRRETPPHMKFDRTVSHPESIVPEKILELQTRSMGRLVVRVVVDLGPITKLIPILEAEQALNTIIILVDDDFVYSPLLVQELVRFSNPRTAVGVSTFTLKHDSVHDVRDGVLRSTENNCMRYTAVSAHQSEAHVLEAYLGIALQRSMFTDAFISHVIASAENWTDNGPWLLADDLVVSFFLNASGVELRNVRTTFVDRESAGYAAVYAETGLRSHHDTGVDPLTDQDECCTNKPTGFDFNCDANMRRYRKYYKKLREVSVYMAQPQAAWKTRTEL